VNDCTYRNVLKRKSITCNDVCIWSGNNLSTDLKTFRSDDVALYAILIKDLSGATFEREE